MADRYGIYGAAYEGDGTSSAEASGSTVTITIASPGVVTWNGHPFNNDDPVYFSTTGALPTGLTAHTKYFVRNKATNTFEVSATAGGASINTSGTQSGTHTANGAGAWKIDQAAGDILNGTTPSRGTLSAGDVVYIRSKTGNGANANKTITVSATLTIGSANATEANPITWILDNGAVWSGVDGVLEWDCTSTAVNPVISTRLHNRYIAKTRGGFFIDYNVADPNGRTILSVNQFSYVKGWKIDNNDKTGSYTCFMVYLSGGIAEDCHCIIGRVAGAGGAFIAGPGGYSGQPGASLVINPLVEMVYTAVPANNSNAVFGFNAYLERGGLLTVIGGEVTGPAADDGIAQLCATWVVRACHAEFFGTKFPKQMPLSGQVSTISYPTRVVVVGADDGYGSAVTEFWGSLDSRNMTYNYPVLNATMPDSVATPWSWRLYAPNASFQAPAHAQLGKLYTSTAATKTVTLEMLIADTFPAADIDRSKIWMTVSYIKHSDGATVTETTRLDLSGTALDSSSASWNTTSWGAVSCNKKKLSLTTQNQIKQNTMVTVALFWTPVAGSTNEQVFICPDVQLT